MSKMICRLPLLALLITFARPLYAQNIVTVCGNGLAGYYGNGIAATLAQMCYPSGIAVDATGNVIFCDAENNFVRKVSPAGIITTIGGTGSAGFSGDGGQATAATFNSPGYVAVDNSGNIFIGDTRNQVVRKINNSGIVSTVVGNGVGGYSGDGGSATLASLEFLGGICVDMAGNLYLSDQMNGVVRKVDASGIIQTIAGDYTNTGTYNGDNIPATNASLNWPCDLKVTTDGKLLIADQYNDRVRMVDTSGIIHTLYADSMVTYFVMPGWLALGSSGEFYIGDNLYTNLVLCVTPGGAVSTFAGNGLYGFSGDGGAATMASMWNPNGIAFDASGNLFMADYGNNRIRKVNTASIISTVAGGTFTGYGDGGTALNAQLTGPCWSAKDAYGNLYVTDIDASTIRKIGTSGIISTISGTGTPGYSGDGGPATAAQLYYPYAIDFDQSGNLFMCDLGTSIIRKIDPSGIITTIAGTASTFGNSGDGGPASACLLNSPVNLKVDRYNRIYICDRSNRKIRMIDTTGIITTVAGNGTSGYTGDGGPATNAEMVSPHGIAFDGSGNLYFADASKSVVRKVTPSGIISTVAGIGTFGFSGDGGPATNAALAFPCALAVDSAGNIFVSDGNNSCIRKIDASGTINTVIGTGTVYGFAGDGGPASAAKMNEQYGISLDKNGNMYIADWGNHRIRKVVYNLSVMPVDVHAEAMNIYPNPNNGSFSVNVHSDAEQETNMNVTDLTGKLLFSRMIKTNMASTINVDLPDGIYIVSVSLREGQISKKVIVMK